VKSSTELDIVTAPKKKEFSTTSPARRLTNLWVPIQFLSPSQHRSSGESRTTIINRLGLTGPIYQHAIDTFSTYSQGPTHRSLIDTAGGRLSTYHSLTFPTNSLHFSTKPPARSQIIQNLPHIPRFKFKGHMAVT
jgi:hypothetical protein